jgi:hypothetical protein
MLPQLPPDPEPTDADLEPYLEERFPLEHRRRFAEFSWRHEKLKEDPNLFAVPFSSWVTGDFEGFPDYVSYRESPLWRRIKRKVLKASNYECAGCSNRATEVHHRDYRPRVLAGECLTLLVPICRECHKKIHAKKRSDEDWHECERILHELVARKESPARPATT